MSLHLTLLTSSIHYAGTVLVSVVPSPNLEPTLGTWSPSLSLHGCLNLGVAATQRAGGEQSAPDIHSSDLGREVQWLTLGEAAPL